MEGNTNPLRYGIKTMGNTIGEAASVSAEGTAPSEEQTQAGQQKDEAGTETLPRNTGADEQLHRGEYGADPTGDGCDR
ncbi:MAG: hypothetical protein CMO55_10315 [Verrucomicrobiales bacterium]|nr:hypothetical protein [Verrucomicrobiales bacterium]